MPVPDPAQCPMDWMIEHNMRLRKVVAPTADERDRAARIVLRVAEITRCTVADLAAAFSATKSPCTCGAVSQPED